jgi:hypothetical protein
MQFYSPTHGLSVFEHGTIRRCTSFRDVTLQRIGPEQMPGTSDKLQTLSQTVSRPPQDIRLASENTKLGIRRPIQWSNTGSLADSWLDRT